MNDNHTTRPDRPSVTQAFTGLSNDELEILANADRFAQNELYPLAQKMDDEEWWPPDAFRKIGETGYFGVTVPEKYGGSGLDLMTSGRSCRPSRAGITRWASRGSRTRTCACTTFCAMPTTRRKKNI